MSCSWTQRGSNPRPLGLGSSTLLLSHCTPIESLEARKKVFSILAFLEVEFVCSVELSMKTVL